MRTPRMIPRPGVEIAVLFFAACGGGVRVDLVGASPDLDEVVAVHPVEDGSVLLFGKRAGPAGSLDSLYQERARIVRLGPPTGQAELVYDGLGQIQDASFPSERVFLVLVLQVSAGLPGADVVRTYRLLATKDAGRTWTAHDVPPAEFPRFVEFDDERHGWVVRGQGLLETNDGGSTFSEVPEKFGAELHKNLHWSSSAQGFVAFRGSRLEVRDRSMVLRTSRDFDPTSVDCIAPAGQARVVVVTRVRGTGRPGPAHAARQIAARSLALPRLDQGVRISGLPADFLCGDAAGGPAGAVLAGARLQSAGFFGISGDAYLLRSGQKRLERLRLRRSREPVVYWGRDLLAAQIDRGPRGALAEAYRARFE